MFSPASSESSRCGNVDSSTRCSQHAFSGPADRAVLPVAVLLGVRPQPVHQHEEQNQLPWPEADHRAARISWREWLGTGGSPSVVRVSISRPTGARHPGVAGYAGVRPARRPRAAAHTAPDGAPEYALGARRSGRLTQRESASFTRRKSGVRIPHRPPQQTAGQRRFQSIAWPWAPPLLQRQFQQGWVPSNSTVPSGAQRGFWRCQPETTRTCEMRVLGSPFPPCGSRRTLLTVTMR